jgi:hypothetical protein
MTRTRKTIVAAFAGLLLTPALSACNLASSSTCNAFTMTVAGKPGGSSGGGSKSKSKTGSKPKSGGGQSDNCD